MQHMILAIIGICLFLSNQNNAKYFLLYFKVKCNCKSFSWQCLFPPGLFHLKPLQSRFKVFNEGGITNNIKGKNFLSQTCIENGNHTNCHPPLPLVLSSS